MLAAEMTNLEPEGEPVTVPESEPVTVPES
jgi:hypothetical protein